LSGVVTSASPRCLDDGMSILFIVIIASKALTGNCPQYSPYSPSVAPLCKSSKSQCGPVESDSQLSRDSSEQAIPLSTDISLEHRKCPWVQLKLQTKNERMVSHGDISQTNVSDSRGSIG
jgi:hypothetical protein